MRSKHIALSALVVLTVVLSVPLFAQEANHKPCLCQPAITPTSGMAKTAFVATVHYSDPDGDVPARVVVYVDNAAYPMRLIKGKAYDGVYRAKLTLPAGEHSYYFYTEDSRGLSERFPRYGAKKGPFVGAKKPYNRLPLLTEGGVYFAHGTAQDIYTYTVNYRDLDCPPSPTVRVIVDGIPHEMKLHSGKPNDGIYLYQTTLPVGPHGYYFTAKDRNGDCVSLPANGFLRGPDVAESANTPPALSENRLYPPIGSHRTKYGYTVEYRDLEQDAPAVALIYVDGVPHAMKLAASKAYNGLYVYRTYHHIATDHNYYFYFEDGRGGECRFPERGSFHGPVAVN